MASHTEVASEPHFCAVLELMAEGLSTSALAARVFLRDRGVEKHVTSIFQKLRLPVAADTHRRVLAVVAFLQS